MIAWLDRLLCRCLGHRNEMRSYTWWIDRGPTYEGLDSIELGCARCGLPESRQIGVSR